MVFRTGCALLAVGLLLVLAGYAAAFSIVGYWLVTAGLALSVPGTVLLLTSRRGAVSVLLLVVVFVASVFLLAAGSRLLPAAKR
ncbi:MAG: hypothetical protein IT304_03440 [Dehalococcoidia bacterium]|nr:hypothetical protein [Dehalococcoidia bacterium]